MAALRKTTEAFENVGRAMAVHLKPKMEAFGREMIAFYQGLQAEYAKAGKPYGDTEEGFNRWVKEVAVEYRRQMYGD